MLRIHEDVLGCKGRVNDGANEMIEDDWPCARAWYGSGCQEVRLRVKGCKKGGAVKANEIQIDCVLFAHDMTVVGTKGEMDESVRRAKEVMGRWEGRNNEDK